ncbi:hypothetical protein GMOD_00006016 [Pyrenophora seminiperda CCB06]|uniref:Uncharacterized protein n=1 Tax=Pyrenophora seminiperda CCB06 TaxID=1302712 RepID=A0A3M7M452_9PLEO|nr:hypothetical protein GMOD_00006016 [Pyrenophora seminiperda CCB06]
MATQTRPLNSDSECKRDIIEGGGGLFQADPEGNRFDSRFSILDSINPLLQSRCAVGD